MTSACLEAEQNTIILVFKLNPVRFKAALVHVYILKNNLPYRALPQLLAHC